jgi:hypothetical protein
MFFRERSKTGTSRDERRRVGVVSPMLGMYKPSERKRDVQAGVFQGWEKLYSRKTAILED